jgi:hypothetical protein
LVGCKTLPFCKRFDFFAAGFDVDFLVGMFLPLFESACFGAFAEVQAAHETRWKTCSAYKALQVE